jgi:hypothetical protein
MKLFVPKKSTTKYLGYYKIRNLLIYTHQLLMLVQKALETMSWVCKSIGYITNAHKILMETPLIKISYWDNKEMGT